MIRIETLLIRVIRVRKKGQQLHSLTFIATGKIFRSLKQFSAEMNCVESLLVYVAKNRVGSGFGPTQNLACRVLGFTVAQPDLDQILGDSNF